MMEFFRTLLEMDFYEQIMAAGMGLLFVLALLLRIALTTGYQASMAFMNFGAKVIKNKEDVKKMGAGAFAHSAKEYMALAEGGAKVDAMALAKMSVYKSRLLFFNFNSMGGLVLTLETAFVPMAILMTLAAEATREFAILAVAIFILMRILASVFDIQTAKDRYVNTLAHVLTREIGKFYPNDTPGAIYTFGEDLKDYLTRQSAMYSDIMLKINNEFTEAIKSNMAAMTKGIEATLAAVSRQEGLSAAVSSWKTAIDRAANVQEGFAAETKAMGSVAGGLVQSLAAIKESQAALANSVALYETSLKDITGQMGDALGKIVAYHLAAANGQIADNIAESLKQARAANLEQIAEIKAVFAELNEQNKQQTRLLLSLIKGGEANGTANE